MTDPLAIIGLIASIASLVLAIVAIWLAIVFYRLSRNENEASSRNAQEISNSIGKLEKVFDGLYSDTFTIMKDTVTDMRQHIWRRAEGPTGNLAPVVGEPDKKTQAQPTSLEYLILLLLNERDQGEEPITLEELALTLLSPSDRRKDQEGDHTQLNAITQSVFNLREQGKVTWEGDESMLSTRTRLVLVQGDNEREASAEGR